MVLLFYVVKKNNSYFWIARYTRCRSFALLTVDHFVVDRFAVDHFVVDRFAVDRFAVDRFTVVYRRSAPIYHLDRFAVDRSRCSL